MKLHPSHHEATLPASSWVNYQPLQPPSHSCPSGFEQGRVIQEQTLVPFLGTMNSEAILDWVPGCVNHNLGKAKKKEVTEIISFLVRATLPKFSLPFPQYFCLWLLPRSLPFPRDPGTSPLIYLWCGSTLQGCSATGIQARPGGSSWRVGGKLQAEQRNWTRRPGVLRPQKHLNQGSQTWSRKFNEWSWLLSEEKHCVALSPCFEVLVFSMYYSFSHFGWE